MARLCSSSYSNPTPPDCGSLAHSSIYHLRLSSSSQHSALHIVNKPSITAFYSSPLPRLLPASPSSLRHYFFSPLSSPSPSLPLLLFLFLLLLLHPFLFFLLLHPFLSSLLLVFLFLFFLSPTLLFLLTITDSSILEKIISSLFVVYSKN